MQEPPAEVTLMEISEDVEGEVESEGVGIESITDPLEPEPAVNQDFVITDPLEPEPSVNQDFVRNENSGQDLELLLNSDSEDEEEEIFDVYGQRVRPTSSQAPTSLTTQTPFPAPTAPTLSLTAQTSSPQRPTNSPPTQTSSPRRLTTPPSTLTSSPQRPTTPPAPAAPPSPTLNPSPSAHLRTSSTGSRSSSRGKGGRRLVCRGNRLETRKLSPEETADLKKDWRRFLQGFKNDLNCQLEKEPLAEKFACTRCDKLITRAGYIRHSTLQGCPNMNPQVKWGSYVISR